MKKIFIAVLSVFISTAFAAENFKNWTPTNGSLQKKNPGMLALSQKNTNIALNGITGINWILFRPSPAKVAAGNTVKITIKASGKGKLGFGYYEYHSGFNSNGSQNSWAELSEDAKEFTASFAIKHKNTTLVRPRFVIPANCQAKVTEYSLKVEGEPIIQYALTATPDHSNHIYKKGENAKFSIKVNADGKAVTEGTVNLVLFVNGNKIDKKSIVLSAVDTSYNVSLKEPGFVLLRGSFADKNGRTLFSEEQIGAAAFSPDEIKAGKSAPADLISYWQGEFAKLNKEIAPEFKLESVPDSAYHKQWKLTCSNFGGTKTYATITMPKNRKGKLPMIFTVPPAGNSVFSFYKSSDAIHVTISVFDRTFPRHADYLSFNKPVWYFYMGAQKRETYYYYKSILGMMRVMDYAMKEIKEWDGKHLAAVGRSQGGGSALILAALNPAIQCVSADVPALCDHNARLAGRTPGWPQLLDRTDTKNFANDAAYFDAANFAAFVKCPAVISAGFFDTMCYPSSIYAAFNNLKGEKQILNQPYYGHGWGKRDNAYEKATAALLKKTFAK